MTPLHFGERGAAIGGVFFISTATKKALRLYQRFGRLIQTTFRE